LIIKRYLWKELLTTFAGVFLVLVLIFAGQSLVRILGAAAVGGVPADLVFMTVGLQLLIALGQLIPFAWFITILLAFGRLYKDNEMTIFAACGVSILQIMRMVMPGVLICALVVATLGLWLKPWAEESVYQLIDEAASRSDITGIAEGSFNKIKQGGMFYVESFNHDRSRMENIFIQGPSTDRYDIFSAPISRQLIDAESGDRYLVLYDGYRYETDPKSGDFLVYEYQEASVRVEEPEVTPGQRKRRAYPTDQLLASDDPRDMAEFHWRIAMPISVVLLSILAILMSYTTPREGRFAKLFGAILIYVVYSNLMGVGQAWMGAGKVPGLLGLWWVHGLVLLVAVILYVRRYGLPQRSETNRA